MSWSYDPVKTDKDKVRLLIGDTDKCNRLLEDEEIDCFLLVDCSPLRAAVSAAEAISATLATCVDEKVGQVSQSNSQAAEAFLALANRLRRRADEQSLGDAYAGGISIADKELREENTDRVRPKFEKNLHNEFRDEHDREKLC